MDWLICESINDSIRNFKLPASYDHLQALLIFVRMDPCDKRFGQDDARIPS